MSEIFISYSREDRATAQDLALALEKAGHSVWWDREIKAGKPFAAVIKKQLAEAKCVIVLWSRHSVDSDWVRDEASKGASRDVLVPALIDQVDIPLGFGQLHAADLMSWQGQSDHAGLLDVLASAGELVGGDTKPVKPPRVSWFRRTLNIVTLGIIGFLGYGAVATTCSNPDWLIIGGIVAFAVAAFFIVRIRTGLRYLWVLLPIGWLVAGMPYGHSYGGSEPSPIFGIRMGELCQVQNESYLLLAGILATAIVIDLFFGFWPQRRRRWVPVACALVLVGGAASILASYVLRHSDQYDHAEDLSRKYGYFSLGDERWNRPRILGFQNDFSASRLTVRDAATDLVWQRAGSPDSISFAELQAYLRDLNASRYGGFDDWRIPTLAEAWTLLENREQNGLHVDPLFGTNQTWIWTSTIAEDGYGWKVYFNYGKPMFSNAWQSHAYVRAVRGPVWE